MVRVFVVKLRAAAEDGTCSHYHAKTAWEEGDISALVVRGREAYRLHLAEAELKELGRRLGIGDIGAWAEEAFQRSSSSHVFSIAEGKKNKNKKNKELVWRRVGEAGEDQKARKMKLRVGSFALEEVDFEEGQKEVLDAAVDLLEARDRRVADLAERQSKLMGDVRDARRKVAEFSEGKEEAERQLYERFLPILQSKQDKIRQLMSERREGGGGEEDSYGSGTDVDGEEGDKEEEEESAETPSKQPRLDSSNLSQRSADDSQNFLKIT